MLSSVSRACLLVAAAAALSAQPPLPPVVPVDPALPDYHPAETVSGRLEGMAGMDTVEGMMHAWAAAFRAIHPGADVTMTEKELAPEERISLGDHVAEVFHPDDDLTFENAYGYAPFRIKFARGAYALKSHVSAIGVFVNQANPISQLSLKQLDAIYSEERRRGGPALTTWGQLGLRGEWANRPIHTYGFYWRDDVTTYFRKMVMFDAPFHRDYLTGGNDLARRTPQVAHDLFAAVVADSGGVVFANFSYGTPGVKALALSAGGGQVGEPTLDAIVKGEYPLERDLYFYVNRPPGAPLPPLIKEFLTFVLSKQGQALVEKDHYFPLSAATAAEERSKLN